LFLTQRKRYAGLFKLRIDDYEGWAKGLRAAGYATDKKYPQKLISLIERYDLDQYDAIALGNPIEMPKSTPIPSGAATHTVQKGDTLYSLGRKYGLTVDELKQKNKLRSNDLSIGQVLIVK
jgi:LysM repeat protein